MKSLRSFLVPSLACLIISSGATKETKSTHLRRKAKSNLSRIIGGNLAKDPYPYFGYWQAGCGASLIHDDMMLTAQSCFDNDIFAARYVYLGGLQLEGGLVRTVVDSVLHPAHNDFTLVYDFLLLKLNTTALEDFHYPLSTTSVTKQGPDTHGLMPGGGANINYHYPTTASGAFVTGLQPIRLNRDSSNPREGDPLLAMGFGKTDVEDSGGSVDDLYEVEVTYVSDTDCAIAYEDEFVPDIMFCAGHPTGGRDTCNGDGGGPLVDANGLQVGVVSWGESCGLREYPGVYAQVDVVADWIDNEICKNSCYPPDTCDPDNTHPCATSVQEGVDIVLDGPVEFTVTVTMDTYPSEFGASLRHTATNTELWYVAYDTWANDESPSNNPLVVEETFSNLPAGVYHLRLGDSHGDGLCCGWGEGGVVVTNGLGIELWSDNGRYKTFEEVYMNISATGNLIWAANNEDGTIDPGWGEDPPTAAPTAGATTESTSAGGDSATSDYDPANFDPTVNDVEWPGAYPTQSNAITINVHTDRFPEETDWTWSWKPGSSDDDDDWETISTGMQLELEDETLYSFEELVNPDTLYRLKITDSVGDGNCCVYGGGWFTMTTTSATTSDTVVWAMTGDEFKEEEEVFVWVDANGDIQEVVYLPGVGYAVVLVSNIGNTTERIVLPEPVQKKIPVDRHDVLDP